MLSLIFLCAPGYAVEPQAGQTDQTKETTKKEAVKQEDAKTAKAPAVGETELEEVVVTATRSEKSVDWAPGDAHVVTKKEIETRNIKAVDEALNMTPGVFNRRGKGLMDTLANISLRGVPGANRTLILRDGMPMNTAYTADVNWGGAIGDIERIEVVEGPFSSLYGGNAMAGVVNILTRMPEKSEFLAKTGYGSSWVRGTAMDDLFKSYISYGNKIAGKFSFLVSYGFQSTNGYPTDRTQGTCPATYSGCEPTITPKGVETSNIGDKGDNKWWDDSILVKTGYDFSKDTKLLVSYGRTRSEYNRDKPNTYLTNSSGVPSYYPRISSYLSGNGGVETNMYTGSFETQFGLVKAKFNAGMNEVQKNWYTTPSNSKNEGYATSDGGPGKLSSTPSQNYYSDLQFTFPLPLNNVMTAGVSFRHGNADNKEYKLANWRYEDSKTDMTYRAGGKDYTYSLFFQDEIGILKNLTAYIGARADFWSTSDGYADTTGGDSYRYDSRSDSAISPKFALVYKPIDGTTLRSSVGRSFRPPTVYELYRTWESSTGTKYDSNPNLTPETSTTWDIGVEQKLWKGAKAKVTYFENYFDDMIYRKSISSTEQQWVNAGAAQTKGFVGEVEQKIRWFRFFANATYLTDSKITKNDAAPDSVGKKITYQPEELYNGGVEFRYKQFFAGLTGMYVGKMYRNDDNSDVVSGVYGSQDPYFVMNAKIAYTIKDAATVSFAVDNLLNRKYYAYYLAPGRSWFAELTLKF
jgi:iron complex outermembrane receptor protein